MGKPHQVIATDQKGQPGIPNLLEAVAQLAVLLEDIDLRPLWAGRQVTLLDVEQPQKLAPTCWMINGARARPSQGDAPRHAGKPLLRPLALASTGGVVLSSQEPADQAVFHYLNNMRDLVQAQRDVMLGLLGSNT